MGLFGKRYKKYSEVWHDINNGKGVKNILRFLTKTIDKGNYPGDFTLKNLLVLEFFAMVALENNVSCAKKYAKKLNDIAPFIFRAMESQNEDDKIVFKLLPYDHIRSIYSNLDKCEGQCKWEKSVTAFVLAYLIAVDNKLMSATEEETEYFNNVFEVAYTYPSEKCVEVLKEEIEKSVKRAADYNKKVQQKSETLEPDTSSSDFKKANSFESLSKIKDFSKEQQTSSLQTQTTSQKVSKTTRIKFENGYYEGEVNSKGEMHGKGVYVWNDGRRYEGEWENDQASGFGVLSMPQGHVYEGEWKNDLQDGKGVLYEYDKSLGDFKFRYEGEWKNGKREGMFDCYSNRDGVFVKFSFIIFKNGKIVITYYAKPLKEKGITTHEQVWECYYREHENPKASSSSSASSSEPESKRFARDLGVENGLTDELFHEFMSLLLKMKEHFDESDYAESNEIFANFFGVDQDAMVEYASDKLGYFGNNTFNDYVMSCFEYVAGHAMGEHRETAKKFLVFLMAIKEE